MEYFRRELVVGVAASDAHDTLVPSRRGHEARARERSGGTEARSQGSSIEDMTFATHLDGAGHGGVNGAAVCVRPVTEGMARVLDPLAKAAMAPTDASLNVTV